MVIGMKKGYITDMFKQLEEISSKLDKSLIKIEEQSLIIYNLKLEIKNYQKNEKKNLELIKKLTEENEKLKNQNNKNSNNSSKLSSTNIVTPKKKTGANLYNYRTKTGKKIGGQFKHKGFNLSKTEIEKIIEEKHVSVKEIVHIIKGDSKKKPLIKYRYELEIKPIIEKHIFKYKENAKDKLPKEFYTDVTYGNSIKALSIHLNCYNVIAYNRLSDFFSVISNNIINISTGTLVNFTKEFGKKVLIQLKI